jgi:hypothetical protein
MTAKHPRPNGHDTGREADPELVEYLRDFRLGQTGAIDLAEAQVDRRTAERKVAAAAAALGMRVAFQNIVGFEVTAGPPDLPSPRAAWLLTGAEAAFPDGARLRDMMLSDSPEDPPIWNCPANVAPGDTLLFLAAGAAPALRMLGRAADRPFWADFGVVPGQDGDPDRWWVPLTALVRVEPIGRSALATLGGVALDTPLGAGRYVAAADANRILAEARPVEAPAAWCGDLAFEAVVPGAPPADPLESSIDDIRSMASRDLAGRSEVGRHFLAPVLALARVVPPEFEVRPDPEVHGATVDYAVLDGGALRAVALVRSRIRLDDAWDWESSPDGTEAIRCAADLGVPVLLADCDQLFAFVPGDDEPWLAIDRFGLDEDDLGALFDTIAGHID